MKHDQVFSPKDVETPLVHFPRIWLNMINTLFFFYCIAWACSGTVFGSCGIYSICTFSLFLLLTILHFGILPSSSQARSLLALFVEIFPSKGSYTMRDNQMHDSEGQPVFLDISFTFPASILSFPQTNSFEDRRRNHIIQHCRA